MYVWSLSIPGLAQAHSEEHRTLKAEQALTTGWSQSLSSPKLSRPPSRAAGDQGAPSVSTCHVGTAHCSPTIYPSEVHIWLYKERSK